VSAQASCYRFTTPIAFTVSTKPALLEGDPGGASCIKYTASTGTAITLDWGTNHTAGGVRDLQLIGPGNRTAAVGLSVGPTNGATASRISGLRIGTAYGLTDGFGTGLLFNGGLGFITEITNSGISNSGIGINMSGGGAENLMISDSVIDHNTTGIQLQTSGNGDIHIRATSVDDNATGFTIGNGGSNPVPVISCEGCHFENAGLGASASAYAAVHGGRLNLTNCEFYDDRSTGTSPQMISASGNSYISILSTNVVSNGITISQVVNFSGTSRGVLQLTQTSLAVSSPFNRAYTGAPVFDLSTFVATATPITANNAGVQALDFIAGGRKPTLSGTGACATITTQAGGATAGTFQCTGRTGKSTVTLTLGPTAPNGWTCWANDITHTLAGSQSAASRTAPVMSFSSVTANDVVNFGCIAY